ncbi:MAG TPA: TonB-dependent receptor [Ignavibacteriales bacterium]|nr:TonB-dependent receptor [Ignavibacteriales bacterium]
MLKIKRLLTFCTALMLLSGVLHAQEGKGTIKGYAVSQRTHETLMGVTVLIHNTRTGAVTDSAGYYIITNLPAGNYTLEFRSVGYDNLMKTDVQVRPGRITALDAAMKETVISTEDVIVSAGYFQSPEVSNTGMVNFNNEEIKRSPGAMGDLSRILMAMPSTAKVSDDNNDLIVRGGSPSENGFYVDGMPVPNINHFPGIGSTGGPIGILNAEYIDNLNFLTSSFSSQYGDRLSSIVDITFKEGNKDEVNLQADLNWAGFGGALEGPLPGGGGSWLASFKRSYLDLISKAEGWGMTIRYGDAQAKVTYDINKHHKISLLEIFGDDHESFSRQDALDQGGRCYGLIDNFQNTAGLSWKALWNASVYSVTNLSYSVQSFKNDFNKVSTEGKYYVSDNFEGSLNIKNINYLDLSKISRFEFGLDMSTDEGKYDYTKFADTSRLGIPEGEFIVSRKVMPQRYGAFLTFNAGPIENLTASLGLRTDYYSLNRSVLFSPRISLSYEVSPVLKLNAGTGVFYQRLPMVLLSEKSEFQSLKTIKAYHLGTGLEYLMAPDTRLTFELYDKEYTGLPLSEDDPSLSVIDGGMTGSSFGYFNSLSSIGKGYTRGIELLVQKKLSENYYGIVSASYFRSRYRDYEGLWRNRAYDNKFIFSFIAGYKPEQEWEFSMRWTYAGGCPYTPFDMEKSYELRTGVIDINNINALRYPDYHSLNIRADRKFFFSSQSLDIYLSVWNAYNRKNISGYYWNMEKNSPGVTYQWGIMPIFGIEYEL